MKKSEASKSLLKRVCVTIESDNHTDVIKVAYTSTRIDVVQSLISSIDPKRSPILLLHRLQWQYSKCQIYMLLGF